MQRTGISPLTALEDVQPADLAGMQSGVFDYSGTSEFLAILEKDLSHAFTDAQLVGYAIPYSPRFAPGAQYDYSNTNTVLLGMIVEKVTGQTLAQALAQRILHPLGLHETSYPQSVPLPPPDPTPYEVAFATGAAERLPLVKPTVFSAAGAMVSTLDDMQAWAAALGDGRLIGAELQSDRGSSRLPIRGFLRSDHWRDHRGARERDAFFGCAAIPQLRRRDLQSARRRPGKPLTVTIAADVCSNGAS